MCKDYHSINKKTILDHYPMPTLEELIDVVESTWIFSTLDLKSKYH